MKTQDEIEKAILSSVMVYDAAHLIYFLEPEDFTEPNRVILKASLELLQKGEPVTLISVLNQPGVDRMSVISCLSASYYDAVYISYLALGIKQKNIENKFGKFLRGIYDNESDDGYKANLRDFMFLIGYKDIFDTIQASYVFFKNKKANHIADKIKAFESNIDKSLQSVNKTIVTSMLKQKINEINR